MGQWAMFRDAIGTPQKTNIDKMAMSKATVFDWYVYKYRLLKPFFTFYIQIQRMNSRHFQPSKNSSNPNLAINNFAAS